MTSEITVVEILSNIHAKIFHFWKDIFDEELEN